MNEKTNGSLYKVRAYPSTADGSSSSSSSSSSSDEGTGTELGEEPLGMVTVRLRGQGFLMNQIRLMLSAAVLYARGVIPLEVILLSLETPYRFSFPLAPAEGLLLVDSGYSRNISGQHYSLHPQHEEEQRDRDGDGDGIEAELLTLMTAAEYETSEKFKKSFIYPAIHQDWNGSDNNELIAR
jgi:hypothetical protein